MCKWCTTTLSITTPRRLKFCIVSLSTTIDKTVISVLNKPKARVGHTTFSIMTLSIKDVFATLSITTLSTMSLDTEYFYAECHEKI
jgi:hypothetical protein